MIWKPHVLAAAFFVVAGCFGEHGDDDGGTTTDNDYVTADRETDADTDADADADSDADSDIYESTPGETGG